MAEKELYYLIAGVGTLLFLIKLVMMSFGGDLDGDGLDDISDMDGGDSFQLFSVQSFFALLMGVGWSGLAFRFEFEFERYESVAYSALFGFGAMFLSSWLMLQVKKLNWTPTQNQSPQEGAIGKVYTPISKGSPGEIQISVGGKLSTVKALTEKDEVLDSFTPVKVIRVESDNLVVVESI